MNELETVFGCVIVISALIALALVGTRFTRNKSQSESMPEIKPINTKPPQPGPRTGNGLSLPHPLSSHHEIALGGNAIPPGMKECYQCKTLIRADALTCAQCGKDPSKTAVDAEKRKDVVNGCLALIVVAIVIYCGISIFGSNSKANQPSDRCIPATEKQLDFINYAVSTKTKSNYIETGYAVKSDDFKNVYMVAVLLYGPSIENGAGPAVFAVAGDPDTPHTWMSVNSYAKEFTDFPDASTTDAEITISADGVEESISCAKNKK